MIDISYIVMLLLAEVTITLSMGLWNSIMHWAALCEDSNVNLVSLILSTTDTHLVLCNIHASNPVNFLINLMQYNANCCVWYLAGRIIATHWTRAMVQ